MSKVKYPGFWRTADYIRFNYRWVEPLLGTAGLLEIVRNLMEHFHYAMRKNGLQWARDHWLEHIDEYLNEKRYELNATQDYLLTSQEYDCLRDQLAEY